MKNPNAPRQAIALKYDGTHAPTLSAKGDEELAEEILRARARDIAWWDEVTLSRYVRRRRAHNTLILNSMTGFQKLFASHHPLLVVARNIGMRATNSLLPVKQELARVAMGLSGDLPQAARTAA